MFKVRDENVLINYVGGNTSCYILLKKVVVQKTIAYQTMTAEGKASLRKFGMLCNDSLEKPVQVALHEGENLM